MRYLQELAEGAKLTQIKHSVLIAPADTPWIRLHPDIGLEGSRARVPQIGVNVANICAEGDKVCHMRLPGTISFNTGLMGHGPHGPIARQAFAALCVANDQNAWSEPDGWR